MQSARAGHDTKKKIQFWLLTIDSRIDTVLLFATAKTTCIKYLQKRKKELCTQFFDEMKNNPTYSATSAKHAYGKFWNFFLILLHFSSGKFILILATSLKFLSVTRENFNEPTALQF